MSGNKRIWGRYRPGKPVIIMNEGFWKHFKLDINV